MPLGIIFISLLFMVLGMIVQYRLKSKFTAYSKIPVVNGLSGKEIAEKMTSEEINAYHELLFYAQNILNENCYILGEEKKKNIDVNNKINKVNNDE